MGEIEMVTTIKKKKRKFEYIAEDVKQNTKTEGNTVKKKKKKKKIAPDEQSNKMNPDESSLIEDEKEPEDLPLEENHLETTVKNQTDTGKKKKKKKQKQSGVLEGQSLKGELDRDESGEQETEVDAENEVDD